MAASGVTSTIQLPPDSTGKILQTYENTVAGTVVESQAVVPKTPEGDDATRLMLNTLTDIYLELKCLRQLMQLRQNGMSTDDRPVM